MSETIQPEKNNSKTGGIVAAVIVLAIMVLALVVFVSTQKREMIQLEPTASQASAELAVTETQLTNSIVVVDPQNSVVNVNGIVIVGGLMVLIVLAAVLREAIRYPR